jgi:hypothetical protein
MYQQDETKSTEDFKRKHLPDGTWMSICLRCYDTITRSQREEDLAGPETGHECIRTSACRLKLGLKSSTHASRLPMPSPNWRTFLQKTSRILASAASSTLRYS